MLFLAEIYSPAPSVSISAATSISARGMMGREINSGHEIPAAASAWREEIYTFPINQIIAGAAKAESKPESSMFCLHSSPRCRLGGCNYSIPPWGERIWFPSAALSVNCSAELWVVKGLSLASAARCQLLSLDICTDTEARRCFAPHKLSHT